MHSGKALFSLKRYVQWQKAGAVTVQSQAQSDPERYEQKPQRTTGRDTGCINGQHATRTVQWIDPQGKDPAKTPVRTMHQTGTEHPNQAGKPR